MNNLEKLLQDSENGNAEPLFVVLKNVANCSKCPVLPCDIRSGGAFSFSKCAKVRARWLLEEYTETDSWEKIEADAKLLSCEYWKCCGMSCSECPAYFNGFIKPKEFYGVGSCDKAKACDLVERAKKLAGVE